ncbi:MAG: helix-turn-helix domain-containing protein [Faecalibacterium longum]|nr:helix-turn-helix domain-containing protein [Faecalibacterium prausnitzii]MDY5549366.1 helix-turn-helix domain-containing protein [Faecalibacterium longum]
MAKRAYCKNTVKGTRRGQKYPPKVRAEVLMAMLSSGSICAVARRYGVPESTIRSWMAEEASRSDAFAKERQAAAREIAIRASLGARAQVSYLQSRVDESQRAAQVQAKLHRKLDEDTRARCFAVGTLLKSDAEETGLVLYAAEDSYDRQLGDEERKLLDAQLERYSGRVMSDKNAAAMATVLMTVAEKAAAMVPAQSQSEGDAPPLVEIGAESREEKGPEVMVDGA